MSDTVDVAINVFGKPRQTALTLLSLLRHADRHIRTVYLLIERSRPRYDTIDPAFLGRLSPKIHLFVPRYWLGLEAMDTARLGDRDYRHSLRYQYAWERAEADRLLILHNDVYFTGDVIGPLAEALGDHVAAGRIGQCWNCPARRRRLVQALGVNGGEPCASASYDRFRLSFEELDALYRLARDRGEHIRAFLPRWSEEIREHPWPLPECRVNEVCCLINLAVARRATVPLGRARPFGAYVSAGCHNMDIGTAWFRDVNLRGLRAVQVDTEPYAQHFIGHSRLFDEAEYRKAEDRAAEILRTEFPDFAAFCRRAVPGLLEG